MPFGKHLNKSSAHGHIQITDPLGGVIEQETKMCTHCGKHWVYQPGSGKTRGFCMKCNGLTCGKRECDACYPYEQRIDDMEKPPIMQGFTSLFDEKLSKIRDVVPPGWKVKNGILTK